MGMGTSTEERFAAWDRGVCASGTAMLCREVQVMTFGRRSVMCVYALVCKREDQERIREREVARKRDRKKGTVVLQ